MRNFSFETNLRNPIIGLLILMLLGLSSCRIAKQIADQFGDILTTLGNDTNQTLDQAVNDLNGNAENFAEIMRQAINEVDDQNIKNQLQNALDAANQMVVTASTEIKCNIQFTADYLVKRIRAIQATYNGLDPILDEPQVCTIIPSIIDMNRPANQRNSVMITGYFLNQKPSNYELYLYPISGKRTKVTKSLTVNTDFKLVINLGRNGITLSENSDKLVLMWDNIIVSEIAVIQRQPEPCKIKEETLTGLPQLVIYPVHMTNPWQNKKGDKEFSGHGPCTTGSVSIFPRNNGTELWASAFIQMWECPDDLSKSRSDFTYGEIRKEIKLANVRSGYRIKVIKTSTNDYFQNIDRNEDRTEKISGSGPVLSYIIQGDMSGSDLGSSSVEINFNAIKVTLEELGGCIRKN